MVYEEPPHKVKLCSIYSAFNSHKLNKMECGDSEEDLILFDPHVMEHLSRSTHINLKNKKVIKHKYSRDNEVIEGWPFNVQIQCRHKKWAYCRMEQTHIRS